MKAHFLIAIAANDDAKQPDAKGTLKAAFAQASLPATVEVFEGTQHGWCPSTPTSITPRRPRERGASYSCCSRVRSEASLRRVVRSR